MGELQWLRDQLARYTYRPDWTMRIEPMTWPAQACLIIEHRAPDSRQPDRTIPLKVRMTVPDLVVGFEDAFALWLVESLAEVERHESREWLRRDGQILDDPHEARR